MKYIIIIIMLCLPMLAQAQDAETPVSPTPSDTYFSIDIGLASIQSADPKSYAASYGVTDGEASAARDGAYSSLSLGFLSGENLAFEIGSTSLGDVSYEVTSSYTGITYAETFSLFSLDLSAIIHTKKKNNKSTAFRIGFASFDAETDDARYAENTYAEGGTIIGIGRDYKSFRWEYKIYDVTFGDQSSTDNEKFEYYNGTRVLSFGWKFAL